MASNWHILIIEDDPALSEVLRDALTDEGNRVTVAPDGAMALEVLDREQPDVILLDSGLPGLSSYDFVEAYLQRPGPHAPIIRATAVTWNSPPPHPAVRHHLAKPFDLDHLGNVIRTCIEPPAETHPGETPSD